MRDERVLARELVARHHARELLLLGRVDHHDQVERQDRAAADPRLLALEQQRNVGHDHRHPARAVRRDPLLRLARHQRVDQQVQLRARARIVEDELAELGPVELALRPSGTRVPKASTIAARPAPPRRLQLAHDRVGALDRRAERAQQIRDPRLAGADAARQTDQNGARCPPSAAV